MTQSDDSESSDVRGLAKKDFEDYLEDRGFLTTGDRHYLLGRSTYGKALSEIKRRQRIRDRVRTAFIDLNLVANYIDPNDRKTIFTSLVESPPPGKGWQKPVRDIQVGGLHQTINFIYDGLNEDTDVPARPLFEDALNEHGGLDPVPDNLDRIVEKLRQGTELLVSEYALVVDRLQQLSADQFDRVFDDTEFEKSRPASVKIQLMWELAQRDLPDLWPAILEAAQIDYNDELLQTLKEQTAQAMDRDSEDSHTEYDEINPAAIAEEL